VLGIIPSMKRKMRVMLAHGRGSIINMSSTAGSRGAAGVYWSVAGKHAVERLTAAVVKL